jgi:hypothetical protein
MVSINNNLKAIYIHNVKCGGSYTRLILETYYNFVFFQKNETIHKNYEIFFDDISNIKLNENTDKHTIRKYGKLRFFQSYQEFEKIELDKYFIFTFVRNPYEKLFSAYSYLKRKLIETNYTKIRESNENPEYFKDFNTFVKNYKNINNISYYHSFITQYDQIINWDGNLNINFIGKTENLDNDLINILNIIGFNDVKHISEIFFRKKKNVSDIVNLANEYNNESFLFVNKYFKNDFLAFNYDIINTFDEFKQIYNKKYIENISKFNNENNNVIVSSNINITEVYKDINILLYNNDLLTDNNNKLINIINIIFSELEKNKLYSNIYNDLNDIKNLLKITSKEISNINNNCDSYNFKNKYISYNNYNNKKTIICNKCGFISYNILSNTAHNYICSINKNN